MSGIEHLQDLNFGPRPLVPDQIAAQAWGWKGLPITRRWAGRWTPCDAETVRAVEAAVNAFSRPLSMRPCTKRCAEDGGWCSIWT